MLLIPSSILATILDAAQSAHPNESIGLLDGEKTEKGDLLLTHFFIPPGLSVDSRSASFQEWWVPPTLDYVAVFHSHPSFSNRPSRADSLAASKEGGVQLILCRPYTREKLAAYDSQANSIPYRIIQ